MKLNLLSLLSFFAAATTVNGQCMLRGNMNMPHHRLLDEVISLEKGFTFQAVQNGDNTATFTIVYEGEAWIALGVSESNQMVGAQVVLALPDSGEAPQIYNLNSKSGDGVVVAGSDQQVLTSSSVTQEDGVTTLIFTAPWCTCLHPSGDFIYAYGTSNELGYHAKRGAFSAW